MLVKILNLKFVLKSFATWMLQLLCFCTKTLILLVFLVNAIFLNQSIVLAAPTVSSVSPSSGPTSGGTTVTITGTGFDRVGEIWGKQTTGIQNNIPNDVATDVSGNVYMAGSFEDKITFDGVTTFTSGGVTDAWLAKYNSAGTFLWARQGSGTGEDLARGVDTDSSGNIYVTGSFSGITTFGVLNVTSAGGSDAFIIKYNTAGTEQWIRKGGSTGADISNDISVDALGNPIITGSFSTTATFGGLLPITSSGSTDAFIIKYNTAGTEQWIRRGGGTITDLANGVSTDSSGSAFIVGTFAGTVTFGTLTSTSSGNNDVFVVKYNSAGAEQWLYAPTGGGNDSGNDIDIDTSGNILVTGSYANTLTVGATILANSGNTDAFIYKLNTAGTPQWAKSGASSGADTGRAVASDAQNNVYIAGNYGNNATFGSLSLANSGGNDVFIVGYSSSGAEIWARSAVGSADDLGNGLATDNFSNLYVTGQYLSTSFVFATVTLTNSNSYNPFLVKYYLTPRITIGGADCTNIVFVSTTQLTCVTPVGTSGAKNVVVTNPDGTVFTLTNGFVYGGSLVFSIRNASDTASFNSCNLGVVTPIALASCSYRLKVGANALNGYAVSVQASGGLGNGAQILNDAAAGSGGAGGSNITAGSVGVESYGILINPGSITSGGTIARSSIFNAGNTNSVRSNYTTPQAMLQANNANQPAATDTVNSSLITHNLNIANDSVAGDYSQVVTYTVIANF